jgi:PAS domain S-box-containing protein
MNGIKEFFSSLFDQSLWPDRWHCGYWSDFHGWLYITSDIMIWAAYFTIPLLILKYISNKKNIRFHQAYVFFAAFILLCGLTHLIDAIMFWIPVYRINALVRFFTAIISWLTVYHLFKLLPTFTSSKTAEELEAEIERNALLLKQVEETNLALIKQNSLVENLFNATVDLANVFDTELNMISVNTATEKLIGKSKHELLGKNFTELFPASINTEYHDDLKLAASGIAIIDKTGTAPNKRQYESSFKPLFENNIQYGILVVSRDITDKINKEATLENLNQELFRKNKELIEMNTELEHFTYILSHDLQGPLRKIMIYSDRALSDVAPELKEKIMKIKDSADRMKILIKDVLDYAKTGKEQDISEKFDLNDLLNAVLTDLELSITEKKAIINSQPLPELYGIKHQITQVFYNLISNALKYCDKEPCLEIMHELVSRNVDGTVKNYIEISFKDNGIGFEEQYKEDIFSPFKRLETKFEGTGIGLALVKKIMDNHHGYIDVESKSGEGSVFKIGLPVT